MHSHFSFHEHIYFYTTPYYAQVVFSDTSAHYTDSSHADLERLMLSQVIDFVQFNYSIASRNAEKRLLAIAKKRGVAVIINRPFGEGGLFNKTNGKPLPSWAAEWDIESWAAFFLKYIIADEAVTCVIAATANAAHATDNLKAGTGKLPDTATRKKW